MKFMPLVFILGLLSCSKSLVYSPSLTPAERPLRSKELIFQSNFELFPETRPLKVDGYKTTPGFSANLTGGINQNINLRTRIWTDLNRRQDNVKSGVSLSVIIIKEITRDSRYLFIPRVGMALDGTWIGGFGLGGSILHQKNLNQKTNIYGGFGFIWGTERFSKIERSMMNPSLPHGYALTWNLGVGSRITDRLHYNFELNPIYQINSFDGIRNWILSPSVGLTFKIIEKYE